MTITEALKSGARIRRQHWDYYLMAPPGGELTMANGGVYLPCVSDLLAEDWEAVQFVYRVSRGPGPDRGPEATVHEADTATAAVVIVRRLIESTPHGMGLYVRIDL